MANQLENKVILILGGTGGMGLAATDLMLEEGAHLLVTGRGEAEVDNLNQRANPHLYAITQDASAPGNIEIAIEECHRRFGLIHGIYHVAGGSGRAYGDGPLHELSDEGWDQTMHMNLDAIMRSNRAIIRYWISHQTGGSILNIGSILGSYPSPKYFYTHAYAAAKSGVIGFSKSLASYYAPYNIRVNVLVPSLINTPMSQRAMTNEGIMQFIKTKQPLDGGRAGRPDDCSGAALYFMSDLSRFTTGQVLAIDGGWSISDGQI
jgi:NAD(P)-dependent dehydrogenase (short-subunit alcohol dehydrogenase family)